MEGLDRIDREILRALQEDGRMTIAELARLVNLSATPCSERLRRLMADGYIERFTAVLNPSKLAASLLVFVEITLDRTAPEVFRDFRKAAAALPEVLECHLVSGNFDYLLKARVTDMAAYRNLLGERLLALPGVAGSKSYMVMEEVKETLSLPVPGK